MVGELTIAYEGLELVAEPGLVLTIYTAEPGSASEERLRLLGSWAATEHNDARSIHADERRSAGRVRSRTPTGSHAEGHTATVELRVGDLIHRAHRSP